MIVKSNMALSVMQVRVFCACSRTYDAYAPRSIDVRENARMECKHRIVVRWSGKEYDILDLQEEDTVLTLKEYIYKETGVRPERQRLLNLKSKGYVLFMMDKSLNEQLLVQYYVKVYFQAYHCEI